MHGLQSTIVEQSWGHDSAKETVHVGSPTLWAGNENAFSREASCMASLSQRTPFDVQSCEH